MTAKPESALQSQIRREVLATYPGSVVWKIHGSAFQAAGIPDLIGCVRGHFVGLEVKMPGEEDTLTRRQASTLQRIAGAGGIDGVVTSVEDALDLLAMVLHP